MTYLIVIMWHISFMYVRCLLHVCDIWDMTHMGHDSYGTWLTRKSHIMWQISLICDLHVIYMWDVIYMWFTYVTWVSHELIRDVSLMCDLHASHASHTNTTHWYLWHDSFAYVTGMSVMSHILMDLCKVMSHMGWLRLVGSWKLQVSFTKEPYKRDDILQKRPIILRSLLIVATP